MTTTPEQDARIAQTVTQCVPCGHVFPLGEMKTGCPRCGKNHIRSPPAVLPPEVCCAKCGDKLGEGALVPVPANLAALVIGAAREAERRENLLNEVLSKGTALIDGVPVDAPPAALEDWRGYGISPPMDESTLIKKAPPVSSRKFDLAAALATPPPPPI